jgi:ABC-2 type transport system permease protein
MRLLAKMSALELRLFLREPLTVLFALLLPLVVLFVMGGVFGNEAEVGYYRDVGAMNYYVPAYVALVTASVGLISLPAHLAGDRDLGVLKRYHASSIPTWVILGSSVITAVVIAGVSAVVLVVVALPVYDVVLPENLAIVALAFLSVSLMFASFGVLLGALLPTSRAAQALGVLLWFVMLMVGGAGPPPEVLSGVMGTVGDLTPLRHGVRVLQDGWLGLDAGMSWLVVWLLIGGFSLIALRFFRWE